MTVVAGITHLRDGVSPQFVQKTNMSIIGIVGTAPNADATKFPLNEPVALDTNDSTLRLGLGSTGTLEDALYGISAQLDSESAARCVIVRVEEGADANETITNIVGDEASGTGIWALLNAPEDLARTPKLLIVPGYTEQTLSGVKAVNVANGGSGYTSATVAFTGGGGTGLAADVVVAGGVVTAINITDPGTGYTSAPTAAISGDGTGATATTTYGQVANQVCASIVTVANRLGAQFTPEGPTSSRQAFINWLETLPAEACIMHPIRQVAQMQVGDTLVNKPASPIAAGLYARRDAEFDGVPAGSILNQEVGGYVGFWPKIPFSLRDGTTEGQQDLAVRAGIFVRGDIGVDGAASSTGFTFWGSDTLSPEADWLFAHVNRMREFIEIMQVKAHRVFLGKRNITLQTAQVLYDTLDAGLRPLKYDQYILDYSINFDPNANTAEELRNGEFDISFKAEEPAVLRKLIIRSRRMPEAQTALAQTISTRLTSNLI